MIYRASIFLVMAILLLGCSTSASVDDPKKAIQGRWQSGSYTGPVSLMSRLTAERYETRSTYEFLPDGSATLTLNDGSGVTKKVSAIYSMDNDNKGQIDIKFDQTKTTFTVYFEDQYLVLSKQNDDGILKIKLSRIE